MKKKHYFYIILGLALVLALPSLSQAEESSTSTSTTVRDRIRAEVELKNKNIKINQSSRNEMLEKQRLASTTNKAIKRDLKDIKGDIKDVREDFKDDLKDIKKDAKDDAKDLIKDMRKASTTVRVNTKIVRQELELKLFNAHKDTLVRQLNLALTNLKQIRERIVSRITKAEQSGRNMTEAKAKLVIADAKISAAQVSINALVNFTITASSTTATSTATTTVKIKLDKPRQVGEAAIKAVKDAREALNEVVKAIAKNMGLRLGNATTTLPVTATTTVSATTTATTTTP